MEQAKGGRIHYLPWVQIIETKILRRTARIVQEPCVTSFLGVNCS